MPSSRSQKEEEYTDENEEQEKVLRKRRFYPTRIGGYCINAVTGSRYHIQQGSFEELRLFRTTDATGFYDSKGFLRRRNDPVSRDPNFLYYDSPEQYMRHMRQKVPQEQVNRWHTNVQRMFPDGGDFVKAEWDKIRKEHFDRMSARSSNVVKEPQETSDDEWA